MREEKHERERRNRNEIGDTRMKKEGQEREKRNRNEK
jgi:hypothetical protein